MTTIKNAWFINFTGIGNGVILTPILSCFEKSFPTSKYFHTQNQLLSDAWFYDKSKLKNLKGFSSLKHRRFSKEDHSEISSFISGNEINLIVNVRNEGPKYDLGYYSFKDQFTSKTDIAFWDLNFNVIENRVTPENLTQDIIDLLSYNRVDVSQYSSQWLHSVKSNNSIKCVGFGMAASQINKRWSVAKWTELGKIILSNTQSKIVLISGNSEIETNDAKEVLKNLNSNRCELISHKTLQVVSEIIGGLTTFISNDTGLLHIAVAIGIPTIGIYISTNPKVWSPLEKISFTFFENSFMELCPDKKIHCGNCFHYYDVCPPIGEKGDDIKPENVFEKALEMIS